MLVSADVQAQSNPYDGFSAFRSGQGARNSGLAETNGAEKGQYFETWLVNPAGLESASWSNTSFFSSFHPGDIRSFALNALVSRDSVWPLAIGLSRTDFGSNGRYDAEGRALGEFAAHTTQLSLGSRRQLSERLYLGASIHYDWRTIDVYHSHVLHFTIGGIYQADEFNNFGLTLTDLGYEIIPFESRRHSLPLDLSVYWQRELNYLPFTFFLRMQKLNLWNRMEYANPFQTGDQNLNAGPEKHSRFRDFTQEVLRHMVIGGEFEFGDPGKVWLRFSYDHWRNEQLGIPSIRSLEGVSVGFGLQLKFARIDYTWERVYFDAGSHQVSLAFRLFEKNRREKGF